MVEYSLYEKARNNEKLANISYSLLEIENIVQAQFHYFYYAAKTGMSLEVCAYNDLCVATKRKIEKKVNEFKIVNEVLFVKDKNIFNLVILHLLLANKYIKDRKIKI